jgi:hypothetical protein
MWSKDRFSIIRTTIWSIFSRLSTKSSDAIVARFELFIFIFFSVHDDRDMGADYTKVLA